MTNKSMVTLLNSPTGLDSFRASRLKGGEILKGDMYRETIHDGSVSYSLVRVAPPPGEGKHAKTPKQVQRRACCSALARRMRRGGIRNAYAQARAFVYADIYNNQY